MPGRICRGPDEGGMPLPGGGSETKARCHALPTVATRMFVPGWWTAIGQRPRARVRRHTPRHYSKDPAVSPCSFGPPRTVKNQSRTLLFEQSEQAGFETLHTERQTKNICCVFAQTNIITKIITYRQNTPSKHEAPICGKSWVAPEATGRQ